MEIAEIFNSLKDASLKDRSEAIEIRINRLKKLRVAVLEHQDRIIEALERDFKKPAAETLMTEIYPVISEIDHTLKNLPSWTKKRFESTPFTLTGTRSYVRATPKGVVLIISPWNYPFNLALSPLITALAAGNKVVVKPSEISFFTSKVVRSVIERAFSAQDVVCLEGDAKATQSLLQFQFDHIFFTGSTEVGTLVYQQASQNLIPVTLELGGKSPVVITPSSDLELAAQRIVWGKFLNAGQTCVAPDYLLVPKKLKSSLLALLIKEIERMYGATPQIQVKSSDLASIINSRHYERLCQMIEESLKNGARIEYGGVQDSQSKRLSPTLIGSVNESQSLMTSEIFGPLLPLIEYDDLEDAIAFINRRPHPLALYVFGQDTKQTSIVVNQTLSGGVCVNDVILHLAHPQLPFGGVGKSGFGAYHGYAGFKEFSHLRSIFMRHFGSSLLRHLAPPYNIRTLVRSFEFLLKR